MPPQPQRVIPTQLKINLLVYGKVGSGKTTLAATAQDHPALSPVLFLDFEGGVLSVAGRGDIMRVPVRSMDELEAIVAALHMNDPIYDAFQTVVLDSASEMLWLAQQEELQRSMRLQRGGSDRSPDEMTLQDYGISGNKMKRLLRALRDLPRHTVLTAHPRLVMPASARNNPNVDPIEVTPNFTGQLREQVMGLMDFVWYAYMVPDSQASIDNYNLLTRDFGVYRAKTRGQYFAQALGRVVSNTDLPALYNLLLEAENPDTRAALFARINADTMQAEAPPTFVPDNATAVAPQGADGEILGGAVNTEEPPPEQAA